MTKTVLKGNARRDAEAERILRDYGFLIRRDRDGNWYVPSRSDSEIEYCLPKYADACPCADHQIRFATCAHMRAIRKLVARRKARRPKKVRRMVA